MAENPETIQQDESKARVFISYSRKDMAFADRLDRALRTRGFKPLIDRTEIYAFEDWWRRIETLITQADTIIFALSPDAASSPICAKEVGFAASLNKRFAPVVCKRTDNSSVPEPLRRFNYIYCDDDAQFEARMDQLAEALSTDIDWIRKHTEIGTLAHKWEIAGRPGAHGLLLRPPVLEEAENWIASRPRDAPAPTSTVWEYVAESRKHENALLNEANAARRRKRRLELALIALLTLISIAGTVYAIWINLDQLKARGRLFVDAIWPKTLSADTERRYALADIEPGAAIGFLECTNCPRMLVIPKGEFQMAPPASDAQQKSPRKIVIPANFAVSEFEITFDQWDMCVHVGVCPGTWDQTWGRGSRPVINVSWDDAQLYVAWLSKRTGKPYRLLTETEWEYASRAGGKSAYSWGDAVGNNNANCRDCGSRWDGRETAPVGSFPANTFGLRDMHGNAQEWVEDCYQEKLEAIPGDGSSFVDLECTQRVVRGGSWYLNSQFSQSGYRYWVAASGRNFNLGFRVARSLTP